MAGAGRVVAMEEELAGLVEKMDRTEAMLLLEVLEPGAYTPTSGDKVDLAFQKALRTRPDNG